MKIIFIMFLFCISLTHAAYCQDLDITVKTRDGGQHKTLSVSYNEDTKEIKGVLAHTGIFDAEHKVETFNGKLIKQNGKDIYIIGKDLRIK